MRQKIVKDMDQHTPEYYIVV